MVVTESLPDERLLELAVDLGRSLRAAEGLRRLELLAEVAPIHRELRLRTQTVSTRSTHRLLERARQLEGEAFNRARRRQGSSSAGRDELLAIRAELFRRDLEAGAAERVQELEDALRALDSAEASDLRGAAREARIGVVWNRHRVALTVARERGVIR